MASRPPLTARRAAIVEFVRDFAVRTTGRGPSYSEIAVGVGLDARSKSTVAAHVRGLVADGYLARTLGRWRSVRVADDRESIQRALLERALIVLTATASSRCAARTDLVADIRRVLGDEGDRNGRRL